MTDFSHQAIHRLVDVPGNSFAVLSAIKLLRDKQTKVKGKQCSCGLSLVHVVLE